ncbi:hypothetical protein [Sediminibacillus albus]|uniref:Type IV pilus assembly protein PilN n=1 Tax=Sediminibacillus albus TaxID=407036 RepID=A0A1G9BNE9_9BACI|nr:hypothetical protein [Sediminibacillus albus]SDK40923.1 hypothetical protein SAMN05216243_3038 [Sediminibacillus albus]
MTVEINLIAERRKKQPFTVIITICILLVGCTTALLYIQRSNAENEVAQMESQWQSNREELAHVKNNENFQQSREILAQRIGDVEAAVFPTVALLDKLIELLPEQGYFENYQFDHLEGLILTIRVPSIGHTAAYTHELEKQPFIEEVSVTDIVSMKKGGEDAKTSYHSTYDIRIDKQNWQEEAAEVEN